MAYNGLTNAGAAYLAARQANNLPVEFLKAKVGNGIVPSGTDPADLTDIISEKMEVEITDIQQAERTLKMTVQVSNESLTTGFYLTEIAIFVNDNGTPVLYWYIGKDNGTPIHDSTKPMKYKNILNIEVSSTPVTTVNYTGKDLWIDEETLNAKFGTKEKEILEGIQLARTLGLEYGGELNNSNIKTINTVYYDTQNKSFFKCFKENSLNYADSNYYEGISNNDLLLKLQNLPKIYTSSYGDYTSSFNGFIKELGIFTYQSAPDLPLGKHEVKYTAPIGFIILCAWVNWKDNIKVNSYIGLDYERNDTYITVAYHAENTSMSYTVTLLCAKI